MLGVQQFQSFITMLLEGHSHLGPLKAKYTIVVAFRGQSAGGRHC